MAIHHSEVNYGHFKKLEFVPLLLLPLLSPSVALAGPADRTSVTTFLSDSAMILVDVNGDCQVSDVDIALTVRNLLISRFGEQMLPSDLDDDGAITSTDLGLAIIDIFRVSYGKVTTGDAPVGMNDVTQVIVGVASSSPVVDVNFDGVVDILDVLATSAMVGTVVNPSDLESKAWELMEYIGAIETNGVAAFMVSGCAGPEGHIVGISNTWPPGHPSWWPENHLSSMSQSYPGDHHKNVSKHWPPNHVFGVSDTWPPPTDSTNHDPDFHNKSVSSVWPPNHQYVHSHTWNDSDDGNHSWIDHDGVLSYGWWPGHEKSFSMNRVVPPSHKPILSEQWSHTVESSANAWPPNHQHVVSLTWTPAHKSGTSASYPPGHVSFASYSWPGPQPGWPPSHAASISITWGEPDSGDWPLFPPDHSWFTTFTDLNGDSNWPF